MKQESIIKLKMLKVLTIFFINFKVEFLIKTYQQNINSINKTANTANYQGNANQNYTSHQSELPPLKSL